MGFASLFLESNVFASVHSLTETSQRQPKEVHSRDICDMFNPKKKEITVIALDHSDIVFINKMIVTFPESILRGFYVCVFNLQYWPKFLHVEISTFEVIKH